LLCRTHTARRLYGVGLIGAGFFRADPALGFPLSLPAGAYNTRSRLGTLHFISGGLGFLAMVATCFVCARRFATFGQRAWATFSVVIRVLFLAAFVGIALGARYALVNVAFLSAVVLTWIWLSAMSVRLMAELPIANG
jgi:hypothetical protein